MLAPDTLSSTDVAHAGFLPLGSWRLNVYATRSSYLDVLGALFRQRIAARATRPPAEVDAQLFLVARPATSSEFLAGPMPEDGTAVSWTSIRAGVRELFTGRFRVVLDQTAAPMRIVVVVREPQFSERAFRDHLFEFVSKLLFALDCFYVHAGAVELDGRVNVFVGEGSFGKTTTCLRLARAGATILSEDHVLFKRTSDGFVLSGCQETVRVTPKTERFFFGHGLVDASEPQHDGKRELQVDRFFKSAPYRDVQFHRIFFNRVGEQLRLTPIPRQDATLRLIYMTRSFFRATAKDDLDQYLDYFSQLVEGRELFDLELSPDLTRLDELVELLRA
jgi:hypothetical protein